MKLAASLFAVLVFAAAGAAATTGAYEPLVPLVAPDGTRIAWLEGSTGRFWTAYPDGTNRRALGAAFAANGAGLAAWTQRGLVVLSNFALFLVTHAGRRVRLGPDDGDAFSAGGDRVASGSGGQPGQTGPVRIVDLRTRRTITMGLSGAANYGPVLSPDGARVAWAVSGALWVARVGGRPRRVAANASCLAWSPNGRLIAFVAPPHVLRVVSPAGGAARTVDPRTGDCNIPGLPAWSSDSTRIATSANELTVTDIRTRTSVSVARSFGRVAGGFAWAPDGRSLYASVRPWVDERAQDDCTSLWRLDASTLRGAVVVRGCP